MSTQELIPDNRVAIYLTDDDRGLYSIYNEAGQAIERDFESEAEAEEWAVENGYAVVDFFNL